MAAATLVYDDDCGFCTWWARRIEGTSSLELVGFSEVTPAHEHRLPADYERCSHVLTEDAVFSCGASIEEAVLYTRIGRPLRPVVQGLRRIGVYRRVRERAYRWVADHRGALGRIVSSPTAGRD